MCANFLSYDGKYELYEQDKEEVTTTGFISHLQLNGRIA